MIKMIKYVFLTAVAAPLLLTGCSDLFDKGDTEKAFDGPDTVAFKTTENEVDEGNNQTVEIQFISSNGTANSDIQVNFSVESEGIGSDYYTVPNSPVTISSGSTSTSIVIETSDDPDLESGNEATLTLNIEGAEGAEVAENLNASTIFVSGV